jgi:NAD(P)-dependent dehydrogenase (short-subunit alcohol dehydrogenase family)
MSKKTKKYDSPLQATVSGILDLFKKRERVGSLKSEDNLTGKKVLITGSSSGLGLAVAKQLAKLDAEVIMAVRSGIPEKGEEVKKASGSDKIKMLHVDLSNFNSIINLISEVKSKIGKIDVLICNAAVVVNEARKTSDGLDEMFTVNYLSKFVLVNGLIKEECFNTQGTSIPKIIFISSESHRNPKGFEWDTFGEFQEHKMAKTVERYGYYKLLLTTYAQELERRLNTDKVNYSVFALCPGPINSNIAREAPKLVQPVMKLVFKMFFSSPEKAAEPVVYLSASKDVEAKNKDYLFLMSRREVDENASNPENGKRLWEATESLLKKHVN